MTEPPVEIRKLCPELMQDFLLFFDSEAFADNPKWGSCFCQFLYVDHAKVNWATRTGVAQIMIYRVASFILSVLAGLSTPAQAVDDHILFSQATSGAVSAVLSGSVDPCSGSNQFPLGPSTVSFNGNEADINTFFIILDPPPCPHSAQPYQVAASLGNLADGHYTVVWTVGSLSVPGTFEVSAGILQVTANAVPTLTVPALSIVFSLIALAGLALLRRRRHSSPRNSSAHVPVRIRS